MRSFARLPGFRIAACGILALLAGAGCSSDSRDEQQPIVVYWVQFPDSVAANQVDSLTVLARVGYGACELERLAVNVVGDSLILQGTALCHLGPDATTPGQWPPHTPPPSANDRRLRVALPPLDAGTYQLLLADPLAVAPGPLADTLVVSPAPPTTRDVRLVGFGSFWIHGNAACAAYPVGYRPDSEAGRPGFLIDGLATPPFFFRAGVLATLVGPATCDSSWDGVIRLRRVVPITLPDEPQ